MYSYTQYIPLTVEEILKRTTEEEIFKIVIQEDIIQNKGAYYRAPYRFDNNPDCYFETYENSLRFIDFANVKSKTSLSCFGIISETFKCSFKESLEIVNNKLNLGLGDNVGKAKKIKYKHGYVEEKNFKKVNRKIVITYLPRNFNYKDKQFWSKYGISKNNLIEDKVLPIKLYQSISKKGDKFTIIPHDICYAYTNFNSGNIKLYRPNANKLAKWFTNCNQNDIGSINNLPENGEQLIISKSYKDCRVLRNQKLTSVWLQNEVAFPSKNIILNLVNRFKKIIIWFDNDNTGLANSIFFKKYVDTITKENKTRIIIIPPKLISEGIKDPSDYIFKKGKESFLEFIKLQKII